MRRASFFEEAQLVDRGGVERAKVFEFRAVVAEFVPLPFQLFVGINNQFMRLRDSGVRFRFGGQALEAVA